MDVAQNTHLVGCSEPGFGGGGGAFGRGALWMLSWGSRCEK